MHRRRRKNGFARLSARTAFVGFCIAMVSVPIFYAVLRVSGLLHRVQRADSAAVSLATLGLAETIAPIYWGGFAMLGIGGTMMGAGGVLMFASLSR